ncbi:Piso0_005572 [Millerozyma farinosa CBS 7064]|uniref:Piso0_005572 protein n=1 Tax=Pichia sorbitophila (strain ATCC MYA-4447 / BCRC 22081 / CBS 7064 / NBRC 10061 / NRRL Y-12695) TaxID=559304 RepID=G8Y2C1_PICSO|nr:Piso0_005572 [Millerozyma farinosa CBS 7064]
MKVCASARYIRILSIRKVHYYGAFKNGFFTRKPFNFETFNDRINQFYDEHPRGRSDNIAQETVIDLIKGGRELQRLQSCANEPRKALSAGDLGSFLELNFARSSGDIEEQMTGFLLKYGAVLKYRAVIHAYLSIVPQPVDSGTMIRLVADYFHSAESERHASWAVQHCMNLLLKNKDYYNAFHLIDTTYASPRYLDSVRRRVLSRACGLTLFGGLASASAAAVLPLTPASFWLVMYLFHPLAIYYLILKSCSVKEVGRLSWRKHTSSVYQICHQHEIMLVNKIITHFEDHNDTTIRNFHQSGVRKHSNLNTFTTNDYVIEFPGATSAERYYGSHSNTHAAVAKFQKRFRHEIQKRRMAVNELDEELMFLEFWLTHGENFEWVEPDQDPAEIIRLNV